MFCFDEFFNNFLKIKNETFLIIFQHCVVKSEGIFGSLLRKTLNNSYTYFLFWNVRITFSSWFPAFWFNLSQNPFRSFRLDKLCVPPFKHNFPLIAFWNRDTIYLANLRLFGKFSRCLKMTKNVSFEFSIETIFVHSKCKPSSLRSQCWMRLFLGFSNTVSWYLFWSFPKSFSITDYWT